MWYRTRSVISVCLQPWCDRRSDQNKMGLLALPPPLPRGSIPWCAQRFLDLIPVWRWPLRDTQQSFWVGITAVRISQHHRKEWGGSSPACARSTHGISSSQRATSWQSPDSQCKPTTKEEPKPCKGGEAWAHRRPRAKRSPVWPGALAGHHFHQVA